MKHLPRIKRITGRDRVRNEVAKRKLKVEPILRRVHEQQLEWFEREMRMNKSRTVKAGQYDKEREEMTFGENVEKYSSGHSLEENVTWNEENNKVRNKQRTGNKSTGENG